MNGEPAGDAGIPAAIEDALPHLSREEILEAISAIAHEYVSRFDGSPESVLAITRAVIDGARSGYSEAIEHEKRRAEEG